MKPATVRVFSLAGAILLLAVVLQGPQAAATLPSDPNYENFAAASNGGTATASTWAAGFEPAKAIDEIWGTPWWATSIDALVVDFADEVDLGEVHIHLRDYAMPDVELYLKDGAGGYSLLQSWSSNAALDLIHTIGPSVPAYGVKVNFPTDLPHTHSFIHTHTQCTSWHFHFDKFEGYDHCHAWESSDHVHYYNETHYALVAEVEAWGLEPDGDGDGLSDGFEESTWYRQEAIVDGLPRAVPDNGTDVLVIPLERPLWSGVATAAFLDLEVDHPSTGDLVAAVGYWDGSAWDDRLVWVPGSYPNATIWDTVVIDPAEIYAATPVPAGTGGLLTLSTTGSPTTSGSSPSGSVSHVTIDLVKTALEGWEADAGFQAPAFPQAELQGRSQWRLLLRDWFPAGGSGSILSARVLTEERSDPAASDTDGDGVLDDAAELALGTFPVALDTDWDALSDVFEKDPQSLSLTIDGTTVTRSVETDPTLGDSDGDGLGDGEERSLGFDAAVTDPTVADTDGDALGDGEEATIHHSNATLTDTDGDSFSDWVEVNARSLALTVNGTAETRSVTTLPYAEDSDGDGLTDDEEWYGTSVYGVVTDPSDPDTDGDGLPDGQERYTKEASLDQKYTIGTYVQRSLFASLSGSVESARVRYGTSGVDAGYLKLTLTRAGTTVVLRDHEGSGTYLTNSSDLTGAFSSYSGSYTLKVWSDVSGGILEDATLSFTILTSPVTYDSDGDGLNDTEELTHGADAWITDPNRADTDGDGWSDGYEVLTKGTSPISTDTDGDGALDPNDIDPLRNLLVKVLVKKIHQDDPWCSPTLAGVVHVNDDYIWVTQHTVATQDAFTSWLCPFPIPTTRHKTASLYHSYYADVPDDVATVAMRASAWSIVPIFWDGLLLDTTFTYTLGGSQSYTLANGAHWMSLTVSTTYLGKIHTLALTDGNMTAQADNGQHRYVAQDRYFVFLVDATSSYSTIAAGMHAFVVPRALYLESQLKVRIEGGTTWPLTSTEFFAEDTSQAAMSEAVTAVTAGSLTGSQAYWLLQYLLQNTTGDLVYEAVDVTSYVPLLNLPTDALHIIPWIGVTSGPTGTMPQDFWNWLGSIANTIVNGLITVGQLIYGGLIAIGNFFVALGEAIVEWGMKLVGTFQAALGEIQQAVARAGEVLAEFVSWAIDFIRAIMESYINPLLEPLLQPLEDALAGFLTLLPSEAGVPGIGLDRAWSYFLSGVVPLAIAAAGVLVALSLAAGVLLMTLPIGAVIVVSVITGLLWAFLVDPIADLVSQGSSLATEFLGYIAGMASSGLSSLGNVLVDFLIDFGSAINGNILVVDAVAVLVSHLSLAASWGAWGAGGPIGGLAVSAIGWVFVYAALLIDTLLVSSPSNVGASVALVLAGFGIALAGIGIIYSVVPFQPPMSLASLISNGLLGGFSFAGFASAAAHSSS